VRYLRADELHTAFNFDFLARRWSPIELRASIDQTLAAHAPVDAPATWLLSNHDVTRPVTRYGRADTSFSFGSKRRGTPTDLELGRRRARAAALLAAALPGSLYIYQGDELGLDEVEDLPAERLQDPMVARSGGVDPGRDGCRVPLPWSGDAPPFGFGAGDGRGPWLPQPDRWAALTVEAQAADESSMLTLYRNALRIRRSDPDLATETFSWLPSGADVLAFRRGERFVSVTNFGTTPIEAASGASLVLASHDLVDGRLPTDATAWWHVGPAREDDR
jgi:alpha-glucosidase